MNINTLLTIVIPTYNRYNYLLRLLKYYESYEFSVKIRILDSSNDDLKPHLELQRLFNHSSIEYIRFSSKTLLLSKIVQGIQNISTKYTVICADDDFITVTGIEKSVAFLENNDDYVVAHGNYLGLRFFEINSDTIFKCAQSNIHQIEFDDCQTRFLTQLGDYKVPTFYAVHRTNVLKSIFVTTNSNTNEYLFGELLPTCLTAIYGKMKMLDILYSARDRNCPSSISKTKSLLDFINEGSYVAKYNSFKKCLTAELCDKAEIKNDEAVKLVDKAMNNYLNKGRVAKAEQTKIPPLKKILNAILLRLATLLKKPALRKIANSVGLITVYRTMTLKRSLHNRTLISYENVNHPEYATLLRIKEIIIKYPFGVNKVL